MLEKSLVLLASLSLLPAQLSFTDSGQQQPKDTRLLSPAVVRVKTGCKADYTYKGVSHSVSTSYTGTGFFVTADGYIVTNARMVADEVCKSGLLWRLIERVTGLDPRYVSDVQRKEIEKSQISGFKFTERKVFLSEQGAGNDLSNYSFDYEKKGVADPVNGTFFGGNDIAVIKIPGERVRNAAPTLKLGDPNTVQVEDRIRVIGYPNVANTKNEDPNSLARITPSVDEGRISAKKPLDDGVEVFQVGVQVAEGSSGSPVLNDAGEVVAVIAFANRDWESMTQVPFAVTADKIRNYLPAGAKINQESATDQLFRDGLTLLNQGDFANAKGKFEQLKLTFPQHPEVEKLMREAQQGSNKVADTWKQWEKPILILSSVVGLSAIAGIYFFLKKRAKKPAQSASHTQPVYDPTRRESIFSNLSGFVRRTVVSQPFVELRNAHGKVRRFYLSKPEHRLGRDPIWADLSLPDKGWEVVSRKHALLKQDGMNYRIVDNQSSNKVLDANGFPIPDDGYVLRNEVTLKIGYDPASAVTLIYYNPRHQELPPEALA